MIFTLFCHCLILYSAFLSLQYFGNVVVPPCAMIYGVCLFAVLSGNNSISQFDNRILSLHLQMQPQIFGF